MPGLLTETEGPIPHSHPLSDIMSNQRRNEGARPKSSSSFGEEEREGEKENDELDAAAAATEDKRTEGEATEDTGSMISI